MTALDILNASARLIGVLAEGEALSSAQANNGLTSMNNMLDSWSNEQMLIPARVQETFPLVNGQGSYQMGSGAPDFNTGRPQKIENIAWQQPTGSYPFNLGIDIITQDEWARIVVPTVPSNIPTKMWPQYGNPYVTLNFWPVPNVVQNVVIWSWKAISELASLTTTFSMQPGYQKAIIYNVALEISPEYGRTPNELVIAQAVESKAVLKRMNNQQQELNCDASLLDKKPTWNWLSGE